MRSLSLFVAAVLGLLTLPAGAQTVDIDATRRPTVQAPWVVQQITGFDAVSFQTPKAWKVSESKKGSITFIIDDNSRLTVSAESVDPKRTIPEWLESIRESSKKMKDTTMVSADEIKIDTKVASCVILDHRLKTGVVSRGTAYSVIQSGVMYDWAFTGLADDQQKLEIEKVLASIHWTEPADAKPADKPAAGEPAKLPEGFVEHKASGVTLGAPKAWKLVKPNGAMVLGLTADTQGSGVNVVVLDIAPERVTDILEVAPDALKQQVPGFSLVSVDAIELNGQPTARLIFDTTPKPGVTLRICQWTQLKNQKQYVLTFTARKESYEKLQPTAEQIAQSVRIAE